MQNNSAVPSLTAPAPAPADSGIPYVQPEVLQVHPDRVHPPVRGKFVPTETNLMLDLAKEYFESREMSYQEGVALMSASNFKSLGQPQIRGMFAYIHKHLPYRTFGSVYEHFMRRANPDRARGKWTPQEEQKLIQLVQEHGRNWSLICRQIGRLNQDVKDKWKLLERKIRVAGYALPEKCLAPSSQQHAQTHEAEPAAADQQTAPVLVPAVPSSSSSSSSAPSSSSSSSAVAPGAVPVAAPATVGAPSSLSVNRISGPGSLPESLAGLAVPASAMPAPAAGAHVSSETKAPSVPTGAIEFTVDDYEAISGFKTAGYRSKRWTADEKQRLREVVSQYRYVQEHGGDQYHYHEEKIRWKMVAAHFPRRSVRALQSEWDIMCRDEHPDYYEVTPTFKLPADMPEPLDIIDFITRLHSQDVPSEAAVSWVALYRPFRGAALQSAFHKLLAVNEITTNDFREQVAELHARVIGAGITSEMIAAAKAGQRMQHPLALKSTLTITSQHPPASAMGGVSMPVGESHHSEAMLVPPMEPHSHDPVLASSSSSAAPQGPAVDSATNANKGAVGRKRASAKATREMQLAPATLPMPVPMNVQMPQPLVGADTSAFEAPVPLPIVPMPVVVAEVGANALDAAHEAGRKKRNTPVEDLVQPQPSVSETVEPQPEQPSEAVVQPPNAKRGRRQ